jgi:hypothetical protein
LNRVDDANDFLVGQASNEIDSSFFEPGDDGGGALLGIHIDSLFRGSFRVIAIRHIFDPG